MIQFNENIYGRFLHHQCNYLFAYQSVCCFVLLLLLKFNQTEIQITKYYVEYKVMVVVYNPNKIKTTYEKNDHSLNVIFIYSSL